MTMTISSEHAHDQATYLNKHSKSFTPRQRSTLEASEPPALAKMMLSAFFNSHWAANATENQSQSKNEWPHHHSAPILVQNNSGPNIHPSDAMGRTRCNHQKQCEQYGRQVHGQPLVRAKRDERFSQTLVRAKRDGAANHM